MEPGRPWRSGGFHQDHRDEEENPEKTWGKKNWDWRKGEAKKGRGKEEMEKMKKKEGLKQPWESFCSGEFWSRIVKKERKIPV